MAGSHLQLADRTVRAGNPPDRLDSWPQHYPWIDPTGYEYFRTRITQARKDVEHALAMTLEYYKTREGQQRTLDILQFKLDILWSISTPLDVPRPRHRKQHRRQNAHAMTEKIELS